MIIISSNKYINNTPTYFKIDTSIKNIIVGHSHPEGTFNDSLIVNTKNLASSGELYFYTFLKIKKLIKENPTIETLFLEFTNNQITNDMEKLSKDEAQIMYNVPKYAPVMTSADYKYLMQFNTKALLKSFGNVFRDNLTFLIFKNDNFVNAKGWGGYNFMDKEQVDSLLIAQKKGLIYIQDVSIYNDINLKYLDKIIAYCNDKNIRIHLIRSPFHKEYLGFNNEPLFQQTLKTKYSNISFFDFHSFPLLNTDYRDLDHLNYKGAKKVSVFFNELLKDSVFYMPNPQLEINKRMKLLSK